ncbi:hypothetical protein H6P81_003697 [Aristolochia fimbriata]|uniref:Uncharacterized protein n=1 Tax=Aristolochia fimbriata TaxID=158543 RepID=A0AAV7FFA6_ARIFI|nr:hypothetical protein H6P81_003697 [Aristolochia fimbriata]
MTNNSKSRGKKQAANVVRSTETNPKQTFRTESHRGTADVRENRQSTTTFASETGGSEHQRIEQGAMCRSENNTCREKKIFVNESLRCGFPKLSDRTRSEKRFSRASSANKFLSGDRFNFRETNPSVRST